MPPVVHLGKHQRHLRLDAGKAAIDRPDVVAGFFLRRVRGVIGRDQIDGAVRQRRPQRLVIARLRAPAD